MLTKAEKSLKNLFPWLLLISTLAVSVFSGIANASNTEQLRQQLAQIKTLAGQFEQKIYEQDEQVEVLFGEFALARPNKLYWAVNEPDESVLIADGETIWYYNPFIEQVSLFSQADLTTANPLLVLLENDRLDDFSIHYLTAENGQEHWLVRSADGQELSLIFTQTKQLFAMALEDGYGQRSYVTFKQLKTNQMIPAERFLFIVPEGVELDDQRGL